MVGSSATLPRNREAMRVRDRAQEQQEVDPSFARIARAFQPEQPAGAARAAVFTALGAVFGFAAAWLVFRPMEMWYVLAALGMTAGALAGTVIARLGQPADE